MELGLTLRQGQEQRLLLLPKMLQAIEVLQLSTQDLVTRIEHELGSNETLEIVSEKAATDEAPADAEELRQPDELSQRYDDVDDYARGARKSTEDVEDRFARVAAPSLSLQDFLLQQLGERELDEVLREIGSFVIGSLDGHGHLLLSHEDLQQVFGPQAPIAAAVALIQSFEPAGIAQAGPQESMLAQIDALHPQAALLERLVREELAELAANRWPKVAKRLGICLEELHSVAELLRGLDPCPGRAFEADEGSALRADVVVKREDGAWQIYVDDARVPPLRVREDYAALAKSSAAGKEVRSYLKGKLSSARELIQAIEQRRETLGRVARAALERQTGFLERGIAGLVPLGMQSIADAVGVHLSTVSRAIAGKHVQTDFGVFALRRLFDGGKGLGADAEGQGGDSRNSVQERLRLLVADEDRKAPLSDEQIVVALAGQGIDVARRTVAKYRKQLGIPSSFRRRAH